VLDRIKRDPGLPAANPTTSTWQNPPHRLANIQSRALPETADIVLIGSGITACSIARTLLNSTKSLSRQPRITILEARTLCSGASGRNGGHLRDSPFMYFGYLKGRFGLAAAKKMAAFRGSQIPEILSIAEVEGLHETAEIVMTEGVDIVFEEGKWESTKEEVEDYERLVKEAYENRTSDEEEQEYIRLTNDTFPEILEAEEARQVGPTLF
jgi:glycine/D-amino acid oxidase-like deaminating enzyme